MSWLKLTDNTVQLIHYLQCCFGLSIVVCSGVAWDSVLIDWSAALPKKHRKSTSLRRLLFHHAAMSHLSAEAKHHILLEYTPGERGHGFKALAARHGVAGGAALLSKWHRRWDHTPQSLEERARSGRPRTLSSAQVRRHIAAPIRNANRAARAVSYPTLLPQVQAATHTNVSLTTIKRYGKEEQHATGKRGKKRTTEECQ